MNIYSFLSLVAGTVSLFFAALVLIKGGASKQNRSFFIATVLTGIWTYFPFLISISPDNSLLVIAKVLYLSASFVPTAWFYFMMNILGLPQERKRLISLCFISGFFALASLSTFLVKGVIRFAPHFSPQPGILYPLFIIFFGTVFLYILIRLAIAFKNSRGYRKSQLFYIYWAYLLGAVSGTIHFLAAYLGKEPIPHDIFIILYPFLLAYAILKYRLMDVRVAITRTGIFVIVYTLVLGLPFVLTTLGKSQFINILGDNWWLVPMILMAALATAGPFLYIFLQRRAESILLREQKHYQEVLKQAAAEMTRIHKLQKLLDLLIDNLTRVAQISHCSIYLLEGGKFTLKAGRNLNRHQPDVIDKNDALVSYLRKKQKAIVSEEFKQEAHKFKNENFNKVNEQMHYLGATLVIPSFFENELLAFFILGDKRSGRTYAPEDLDTFSVLASQAALAIDNALLYENIEEQVRKRTEELVDVQNQLTQAAKLASVGTLAGGVAHEINNPLAAILTNVQMLLASLDEELDPGELKDSLELIEEATKRCRVIVKKLMTYARKPMETQEVAVINLLEVVEKVNSFLLYQFQQENIKITVRADEDKYPVVGNHNEFEQVVTNLVLNAKDATKRVKKSGEIELSLSKNDGWVRLDVKDEGSGIAKENVPKIFDPFFTTKDVGKGLGLGLSISQSIIEKYKGSIFLKSQEGQGTTFTVNLPLAG